LPKLTRFLGGRVTKKRATLDKENWRTPPQSNHRAAQESNHFERRGEPPYYAKCVRAVWHKCTREVEETSRITKAERSPSSWGKRFCRKMKLRLHCGIVKSLKERICSGVKGKKTLKTTSLTKCPHGSKHGGGSPKTKKYCS